MVLLEGKTRTWFTVQGYSFDEFGDVLEWPELHETLLMTFFPAGFERVARKETPSCKANWARCVPVYCSFQQGVEPVLQHLSTGSAVPV